MKKQCILQVPSGGKLSEHQESWRWREEKRGAIVVVVDDLYTFADWYQTHYTADGRLKSG